MSKFTLLAGNKKDIAGNKELASKIEETHNARLYDLDSTSYENNTVTGDILSLHLGLVPEEYEQKIFDNIVRKIEVDLNKHVSSGVLRIQYLMRGLTEYGNVDLAYRIATNHTYPSRGYMIEKGGDYHLGIMERRYSESDNEFRESCDVAGRPVDLIC